MSDARVDIRANVQTPHRLNKHSGLFSHLLRQELGPDGRPERFRAAEAGACWESVLLVCRGEGTGADGAQGHDQSGTAAAAPAGRRGAR